MKHTAQKLST